MTPIRLFAPFGGWVGPLAEVPDAVFSQRMLGDGLALDPFEGVVRAPCAGTVVAVAPTGHSVTLRTGQGADILIHVGVDTVALGGDGFIPHVQAGASVTQGSELLTWDMDKVARRAPSLVTPIVVLSDAFEIKTLAMGQAVNAGDPLFDLCPLAAAGKSFSGPIDGQSVSREAVVLLPNGVHARPAARIAAALKSFEAETLIAVGDRTANARSMVAVLSLGLRNGANVTILAKGKNASDAVDAVGRLLSKPDHEDIEKKVPQAATSTPADRPVTKGQLHAVRAAPGLEVGVAFQLVNEDLPVPEKGTGTQPEAEHLVAATSALIAQLESRNSGSNGVVAAHIALLEDPELLGAAYAGIQRGQSAAYAWRSASRSYAEAIRATGDALLIERGADLLDVEQQLIALLLNDAKAVQYALPERAIVIANELLPSAFLALDRDRLAGIITAAGGPTSHVAILAASAGVPMLVSAGRDILAIANGTHIVLDADSQTAHIAPAEDILTHFRQARVERDARRAEEIAAALAPCTMADGSRIEIFANCGSVMDASAAVALGAEGCGLLRTEFLFVDRETLPSEEEQIEVYSAVAEALGGRPLVVRTLDVGGDKPLPYLPMPLEENPALGMRGIRLALTRPDILAEQFRAILRAIPPAQCRIMLPMIADIGELRAARSLLEEAGNAVGLREAIQLGIMVETPAAALMASELSQEADFLSIGSNDLAQYALAADRSNATLARHLNGLHPAVLRLIAMAAEGAHRSGRWLGLCGGIASDPRVAPILVGLGVDELSVAPASVPQIKSALRAVDRYTCDRYAVAALAAKSAQAVLKIVEEDG